MNMRIFSLSFLSMASLASNSYADLAVGLGIASFQDPQKGMDTRQLAIPLVSYTGDRLSFQVTTLSYRLVELGDVQISALASGRLQGYEVADSPYLAGMKDRSNTVDGGISLEWNGFSLSYTHDLLSKHKGDEVAFAYTKGFGVGKAEVMLGAGVTWQSEKLNQYYYGVAPSEARSLIVENKVFNRTAYKTEDAISPKINALVKYPVFDSWTLIAGAEVNFLPKEITNSPIIENKNAWGVFAGIAKAF
ncbi:membrane protein [Cellvibrio zantedeschiae]|uniref:Membrane protein n=1 Tax=Cellvibrio zantedeschiae TaxID=1237077 RepID=A0ABQ3BED4_9GAMM|nr:MipA/OmpV family protein [Cellvibrio zantedeschiae]GGY86673.1 membrane protein [Cellvibrio zantedeschiae]